MIVPANLTTPEGHAIAVNANAIAMISRAPKGTCIHFLGGGEVFVQEGFMEAVARWIGGEYVRPEDDE